jgi:transcriptional regulator with XRE-family HTH domain
MLGNRLRQLRGKRTQSEVAKTLGITRARYSHYENGRNEPDTEMLQKIADYYGVSIDYLLGGDESQTSDKNTKKADLVDLLEEIKKRPYVIDPKTGEAKYIPKERLKIINDLIEGYLREEGILPDDNGNGEDCAGSL